MSGVFTIPPDRCFVSSLAEGLWRRADGDPLALASTTIYLPTRRACRALREAFLRATGARAALLPRMQPLGDIDEIELDFGENGAFADLPPALPPLRRRLLLTQAILKKDESLPLDQAALLASSLAELIDRVQNEGLDFARLENLVPEEYAGHWQETLRFLKIVTEVWPALLEKEECLDPVARRNALLAMQAEKWLAAPPAHPVIAAGSTGSVPSAARLMAAIASLPSGEVILPGLDLSLDEEAWQAIDETHPQFTMKHWLEGAKVERKKVRIWEGFDSNNSSRVALMRNALLPAEKTDAWREITPKTLPPEASAGIEKLELDHHREEADVIALRLRAALEEKEKTAALVTPDRELAARVASSLKRWGVTVDDSAGTSLPLWPVGSFLIELLTAAAPEASPVSLLALLKHPLTAAGLSPEKCRFHARETEKEVWRGVRRAGGFAGAALAMREKNKDIAAWLEDIAKSFAPFAEKWNEKKLLGEWIETHVALAESMADAENLWRGPDGEAASSWLDELRSAGAGFPALSLGDYARLFAALAADVSVRPAYGSHPRLSILGPLEARLLHHDLVILGGLNEGVWPPAPSPDPWMSRPMKRDFGLPSPERRVGLSAHDFVQMACAKNVLITRARRSGGSPTVPSRLLLQMETVLKASGIAEPLAPQKPWHLWAQALDEAENFTPMSPPEPCPPLEARPKELPVTDIGLWLRNPYAIYAKRILGLRKLDPLDADAGAAEQGSAIHEALEGFLKKTLSKWPKEPLKLLLEEGRNAFAVFEDRPQVKAFWWPRFERIARWFVEEEEARRAEGIEPLAAEAQGAMAFAGGAFTLTGRADRIDRLEDGGAEIIDYKTGSVPSKTKVLAGWEPQLPLLALIAASGGFENLDALEAAKLSYWGLKGARQDATKTEFKENLEEQQDKAREGLEGLIRRYGDPREPYRAVPRPAFAPDYDDYAHLARLKEWGRERGGKS